MAPDNFALTCGRATIATYPKLISAKKAGGRLPGGEKVNIQSLTVKGKPGETVCILWERDKRTGGWIKAKFITIPE